MDGQRLDFRYPNTGLSNDLIHVVPIDHQVAKYGDEYIIEVDIVDQLLDSVSDFAVLTLSVINLPIVRCQAN